MHSEVEPHFLNSWLLWKKDAIEVDYTLRQHLKIIMQSEFSNVPKLTNERSVSERHSSVGNIDGSDRNNTGEMASNLNNSCNQIKIRDTSNEW